MQLLGRGGDPDPPGDLSLVDEVVRRTADSGVQATCRLEGDHAQVPAALAHLASRVVQESLTNALRHSPGADIRVRVAVVGRDDLTMRVENDAPTRESASLRGTSRGLVGLRERVQARAGTLEAGPDGSGGWAVEAHLPLPG